MLFNAEKLRSTRTRLHQTFDRIFDVPLTSITAPVGYDKTLELTSFFERRQVDVRWLSIPKARTDQVKMFAQIVEILSTQLNIPLSSLQHFTFPLKLKHISEFISVIRAMNYQQTKVLVLEHYDRIQKQQFTNRLIRSLAEANIPHLHIVLLTKRRIIYDLSDLREARLYYEIDTSTLAYTPDEIADLMSDGDLVSRKASAASVYRLTGGWPLPVRLMVQGHKAGQPYAINHQIEQFLYDGVYAALPESYRLMLDNLALFDRFSVALASHVFEGPINLLLIQSIVRQSSLLITHETDNTYTFQPLFAWFLRRRLAENKHITPDQSVRAARWCIDQGYFDDAVRYYDLAGRIDEYIAWANEQSAHIAYESLETVKRLNEAIPQAQYLQYPFTVLNVAMHLAVGDDRSLFPYAQDMVDTLDTQLQYAPLPSPYHNAVAGILELVRFWLSYNDLPKMLDHADKATDLLLNDKSCVFCQKLSLAVGLPQILYAFYKQPGSFGSLLQTSIDNLTDRSCDVCRLTNETAMKAEAALETGDFATARTLAKTGYRLANTSLQLPLAISTMFVKLRLNLLEGQMEAARKNLDIIRLLPHDNKWHLAKQNIRSFLNLVDLCEAYATTYMHEPQHVKAWIKEESTYQLPFGSTGFISLLRGRMLLQETASEETEAMLETHLFDLLIYKPQLARLHLLIQLAAVQFQLHGIDRAAETLSQALTEAACDNLVTPFFEYAHHVLPILPSVQIDNPDFLEKIEAGCRRAAEKYPHKGRLKKITLTSREIEVLRLLEAGLTRKDIADQLMISMSTVKRHIENIFRKVGASKATQAVQLARKHKLL